jgi:uncharacterized protein YqeY
MAVGFGSAQAGAARTSLARALCARAPAGCLSLIEGLDLDRRRSTRSERGGDFAKAIAVLRDEINSALKAAMKARDERRVSTLRLANAAIKNADIEAQMQGKPALVDADVLALLQKMVKQRQESVDIYDKAGRAELAERERAEIEIIRSYLPQQMSEAQAKAAIAEVIEQTGASGIRDMGKVMAALKQGYAGKMDFGKASGLVKGLLAEQ